ncbi:MAG: MerR family transcriptional regulator [Deltaproteobacteria bacterium]|nr:MerR family transcriptional regulator [Deltaproteobacteria bacterium]NCP77686.1 MerR family transcriptional regulator [Desulfuromonadales bacterium]
MINIQQLSQELGIGIDTLRVWERRYGCPKPQRDRHGHRSYTEEQRQELGIVRKLQDLGERPGNIFALSPQQRQRLLEKRVTDRAPADDDLRQLALTLPIVELTIALRHRLSSSGLYDFIHKTAVPLLHLLGYGWVEGSISIAREHFISDLIESMLQAELRRQAVAEEAPHLLFLNLSGERHRLGLLMAAALFQLEGCRSRLIQEHLPLNEVAPLTKELAADAVALSFSGQYPELKAKKELVELRRKLPAQIKLIAGGSALKNKVYLPGILLCSDLHQIPDIRKHLFGAAQQGQKEQP